VSVSCHFLLQAPQCPCSCEHGSAETTVAEGGRNLVAGLFYNPSSSTCTIVFFFFLSYLQSDQVLQEINYSLNGSSDSVNGDLQFLGG